MTDVFEYVNFGARCNKKTAIADHEARIMYREKSSEKFASYYMALSSDISQKIVDNELYYMRTRINTLTGEIYVVFQKEATPDAIRINTNRKKRPNVSITRKSFVEYIINKLHVSLDDCVGNIHVSDNKSQIPNVIVLQLSKSEKQ